MRSVTVPSPTPRRRGAPPALDRLPDPRNKRQWASLYLSSLLAARANPDFSELEHFCFFIGYARSGHTLVATLLNAHPEVVIAHELDAARFVRHGFGRRQLFSLLLERDRQFGDIGRTWSGYRYEVPDQFQGRYERLRVIGDKRARASVLQIAARPQLLDRLRRVVEVPIRVVHVTRNPFDNIATESRRHNMSLSQATAWYEQICRAVRTARPLLDPSELVDLRYEDFAGDTPSALADLCQFVGVEAGTAYLEACASIVWPSTNRSRDSVEWSAADRRGVERLIETYDVLQSYAFDDD
jgi:Sulfotransferase family